MCSSPSGTATRLLRFNDRSSRFGDDVLDSSPATTIARSFLRRRLLDSLQIHYTSCRATGHILHPVSRHHLVAASGREAHLGQLQLFALLICLARSGRWLGMIRGLLGNPPSARQVALLPTRFSLVKNNTAATPTKAAANKTVRKHRHLVAFIEYCSRERQ
jgi:hypothetical protein